MRASEMRSMSVTPWRRSLAGIGSWPHSGMPGPPLGPPFLSTSTVEASTGRSSSSMCASNSARVSKT